MRAALEGRVLVLEGIEKAERNVLPVLNNLLENREMNLDDGRFMIAPEKYDKLLEVNTVYLVCFLKIAKLLINDSCSIIMKTNAIDQGVSES